MSLISGAVGSESASVIRLNSADTDWVADFLTNVFIGDPPIRKLFSPPNIDKQVRFFMRCNSALALQNGECYATEARDGVALWLPPGKTSMTVADIWRAGMFWSPLKYGPLGTAKVIGFAHHIDAMQKRYAPMPHYYLFLTGVDPKQQRQGVCRVLLANMLQRSDNERLPIYLETQSAGNVEIYEKFGFDVLERQAFPGKSAVFNWGMLRQPLT